MKFQEQKTCILGINGSGKTEFAKFIARTQFKRPVWVLVNNDDLKTMPKNAVVVLSTDRENRAKELNDIIRDVIQLAKEKKVDAIFIDEADLFINDNSEVKRFPEINDMIVLQRHHGLAVFVISRRPANLPTMLYETCDNIIIYACPKSDNVDRKFRALDREIPDMVSTLKKGNFNFVAFTIGENPEIKNPIPLQEKNLNKKQKSNGEKTKSGNFTDVENKS